MSTTEKMTQRVRGLFAKAESVAGTPEADVFLAKAMELLAKYGIDESVARAGAGDDSSEIGTWEFIARGKYPLDQLLLVNSVSKALHCSAIRLDGGRTLRVYGAKRHLDRVEMLAGMLVAHMLATAGRAKSPNTARISTVTYRKSVMRGFTSTVVARLREAEESATAETSDATGTGVVLLSDARRANAAMRKDFSRVTHSGVRRSSAGYDAGAAAASGVDLGGRNRVGGRAAISA